MDVKKPRGRVPAGWVGMGVVLCLVAVWSVAEWRRAVGIQPPAGMGLAAFVEAGPAVSEIRVFTRDGDRLVEVIGELPSSPLALASGPPGYVFDSVGKLDDWTADRGDDAEYVARWGGLDEGEEVSKDEAKRIVAGSER